MFRFIQEQESHSWHTVPVSRLGSHWPFVLFCSQQHIHTRCRARWCLRPKIQCSSSDCQQGQVGWRSALPCTIIHVVFSFLIFSIYQYSRTRRWRKFQKGKIYNAEEHVAIESFVTTLIHWTFFSDDANKVGICWLCRSGQLHVTPSSRWSLPRCHRSVRNDMRLFLRTKQYPVQLRTTKYYSRRYYSSTTKY